MRRVACTLALCCVFPSLGAAELTGAEAWQATPSIEVVRAKGVTTLCSDTEAVHGD